MSNVNITPHNQLSIVVNQTGVGPSASYTNVPNPSTIGLSPSGGTSVVEYTIDPSQTIWQEWALGQVTTYTEDILIADVIAVRVKVISGTATMFIIGGRRG